MKKFLLGIIQFFIVTAAAEIALLAGALSIVSRASFKIPEDRNILIIGDSHTQCAVNDAIFSHGVNISSGGKAYLYSYITLRKFIAENPHIDTVLVSFHGGSIPKSMDKWITADEYIFSGIPDYLFLFQPEEAAVFTGFPAFYSAVIGTPALNIDPVIQFIIQPPLTYKDLRIGGYFKLDGNTLKEVTENTEDNSSITEEGYSEYQLEYLLKIVELCKEKGITAILFNTPTYKPEKYGNMSALAAYYNAYFTGTEYLDFSSFPLPEYGYSDPGHLNFNGAEIFSQYLEDNYEDIFR